MIIRAVEISIWDFGSRHNSNRSLVDCVRRYGRSRRQTEAAEQQPSLYDSSTCGGHPAASQRPYSETGDRAIAKPWRLQQDTWGYHQVLETATSHITVPPSAWRLQQCSVPYNGITKHWRLQQSMKLSIEICRKEHRRIAAPIRLELKPVFRYSSSTVDWLILI